MEFVVFFLLEFDQFDGEVVYVEVYDFFIVREQCY